MGFKIVFMGTPDFAVPSLKMLIDHAYDVAACFAQPDRKAGRGYKMVMPPVKALALEHGILVHQPEKVSGEEGVALLRAIQPDVMVTAAYGQILSEEVLAIPRLGCINVHASLLPKLRGAAPVQWAIINGEKKTGVTTMYTVKKLDAGDILEQDEVRIPDDMTAGELYDLLSVVGAGTLRRTLEKLKEGTLARRPQDEAEATYYPMFPKGFGKVDFTKQRSEIENFVRGTNPVPGAYVMYGDEKIKVYAVSPVDGVGNGAAAGEIVAVNPKEGLLVKAADGVLSIDQIKRQGAKQMGAKESLRGKKLDVGYVFD